MKKKIEQILHDTFLRYGTGFVILSIGFIIMLVSLGLVVQIGGISLSAGSTIWPSFIFGFFILLVGIAYIKVDKRKSRPVLRARPSENINKVRKALERGEFQLFREFILSAELSQYIGEIASTSSTSKFKLNFDHIINLLELAKREKHLWLRCNAVELAGNGGVLAKDKLPESEKKRLENLIEDILDIAKKGHQQYVVELANLKLAMLRNDEERIMDLVDSVNESRTSFYQLNTFDNPVGMLRTILRSPTYDPARSYAAALLQVCISDKDIIRIEVESALAFENGRKEPNDYLVEVLEGIN